MDFFYKWSNDLSNTTYMIEYLSKTEETRNVFRYGTEQDIKFACDVLRSIRIERYLDAISKMEIKRLPRTEEIPQCGTLEKAICEVPQVLAFEPDGLICADLGVKLGAEDHGDAPRKSGEGNGKLADAMDIAIRQKLPTSDRSGMKYGYKISSLGSYLLRFSEIGEKMDVVSRLLVREYVFQAIYTNAADGYASYDEIVSSLKSPATRMRRRQNVRRIVSFISGEEHDGAQWVENIDWDIEGK